MVMVSTDKTEWNVQESSEDAEKKEEAKAPPRKLIVEKPDGRIPLKH